MERSRVTLLAFVCVLFSRMSGEEVEMRVRPGDNVILYSDCVWKSGFHIVWFRNSSHEHQSLLMVLEHASHPRYSFVWNIFNNTNDLLVKSVTESDLGLYYCALKDIKINDPTQVGFHRDIYHYGNMTTRLSLLDTTVPCADVQATPTPPVSDCSVCWLLLVSVCPVCVLLSSTCVYCICRYTTEVGKKRDKGESATRRNNDEVGGGDVCYASLDLPSRRDKRLKKKRVECSEFSTYSEVKTDQM